MFTFCWLPFSNPAQRHAESKLSHQSTTSPSRKRQNKEKRQEEGNDMKRIGEKRGPSIVHLGGGRLFGELELELWLLFLATF
jgi:hypothetical protein